jgi:hypothetical protein
VATFGHHAAGIILPEKPEPPRRPAANKDAPAEMVAAIGLIESRADDCLRSLGLLHLPSNFAVWALMGGAIQTVEREIKEWSDDSPQLSAALRNLSGFVPIAMRWALSMANLIRQPWI